jgi:hypothetical protein
MERWYGSTASGECHRLWSVIFSMGEHRFIQTLQAAMATGQTEGFKGFADQCMADYDLDGKGYAAVMCRKKGNGHDRCPLAG